MKYNKFVFFIMISSILCLLLLGFGFVKGAYTVLNPQKSKLIVKETNQNQTMHKTDKLKIVALGDSITRGIGDDEGLGYVNRLKTSLKEQYKQDSTVSNLAVSGAKTSNLLTVLQKKDVQETIRSADTIVLSIGGNDLFPGADQLNQEFLKSYRPDEKTFKHNLQQIFKLIRTQNSSASIYAFGYYNPFHNVQGLDTSSSFVSKWNDILEQSVLSIHDAYVIPTFDLFYNEENKYLYTDHFHPNKEGYTEMANRLLRKIGSQLRGESNE
ncbi:GDSL-type esterase/lipase family protein [Bacillus sp. EAC]|uniref:GDSL-type esterase/lipase family protein n=1 Tax=Bacillus sp. EAC TaxID=1978338 RepID=UPI0015C5002F|nr:GDSL-type esterase/lipase family protein [Bacillus sp. EAC]